MLYDKNSHIRDSRICFFSEGHIYKIDDGKDKYTSVTTFIKSFFGKFEADKIIKKMLLSGSFQTKYPGKTPEDVKKEWSQSGIEAAKYGTILHESIENHYNEIPQTINPIIEKEYGFFEKFNTEHIKSIGLKPYRTEWYIFIEDFKIAGSIDMVYQLPNGNICIYDWKRSKKIEYTNPWKKANTPIQHLDDCNFYHYSLQLNLYKYILETKYQKQVEFLRLIFLHPQNDDYIIIEVPNLQKEIKDMLFSTLT